MMRKMLMTCVALGLVACGSQAQAPGEEIRSEKFRNTEPLVSEEEVNDLVIDNNNFGWDIYRATLAGDPVNIVFSPYSISSAFGMLYAGAAGDTQSDMADGFRFGGREVSSFHDSMNAIELALPESDEWGTLRVANDIWVQTGFEPKSAYLDTLAESYGAGMHGLDFATDASGATELINGYISDVTETKIPKIFEEGSLNASTVLALTNAIYFKASWKDEFKPEDTRPMDFNLLDGTQIETSMMYSKESYYYGEEAGSYRAIEIPYKNEDLAMLVVMPDAGTLADFESAMDANGIAAIAGSMTSQEVSLDFPSFELNTNLVALKDDLETMGLGSMFDPGQADFSGIADMNLFVQTVAHKAYILVNEEGTEAAAATGVGVGMTSAPMDPVSLTVDKPFLYFIRHLPTGNCLFMGRVVNPTVE
ncbi:MAG: serpin family protein [Deltaproteobacteria bacterium]|nr:serpin family protein [Deltaproteobacteria bacterium]MBT6436119.1 serpin family protein [Deltaproteobacteria bacterium]MBT6489006.1 serpin family protein [Deltaproteobacteria bacterium]